MHSGVVVFLFWRKTWGTAVNWHLYAPSVCCGGSTRATTQDPDTIRPAHQDNHQIAYSDAHCHPQALTTAVQRKLSRLFRGYEHFHLLSQAVGCTTRCCTYIVEIRKVDKYITIA